MKKCKVTSLIFLFIILLPVTNLLAGTTVSIKHGFLNQEILFKPFLADTRNYSFSMGMRFGDSAYRAYEYDSGGNWTGVVGSQRIYWTFSFGDRIGIYQWNNVLGGKLKISLEGGGWSIFALRFIREPDEYVTSMINIDFRIGIPITWSDDTVSFKVSVYHQSSHLGDELMYEMEMAGDSSHRVNPSVEVIDAAVSWQIIDEIRIYLLLGVHLSSDATYAVAPFFFEWGAEFVPFGTLNASGLFTWSFYIAAHMRNWQDHNFMIDGTYVIGFQINPINKDFKYTIRIFGEYHHGYSYEGQFSKTTTDYFGFSLSFGF